MIWPLENGPLQRLSQYITFLTTSSFSNAIRDCKPPRFTSRLYKLPQRNIFVFFKYIFVSEKDVKEMHGEFAFYAFNFDTPVEVYFSHWREENKCRKDVKSNLRA